MRSLVAFTPEIAASAVALHGDAINERLTTAGENLAEQDAERRAFARAIVAEKTEDFTLRHRKRKAVKRRTAFEGFGEVLQLDHARGERR